MKCDVCVAQAGQWTWMKGDSTPNSPGTYGIQGVADPINNPPGVYEPAWWKDTDGNFWLLGGYEYTGMYVTALWKYDLSNNQWTWMKGPATTDMAGIYGTMGIPSANNFPGSRCGGIATWTDTTGNLWMFGGFGYDVNGISYKLSDVWRYEPATNEWTWMSGSEYTGAPPDFGTYQNSGINVTPGNHGESTCSWKDTNDNFWVYGGDDYSGYGKSSAMFKYDYSINEWAWMWGGPAYTNVNYGAQGISSSSNSPGSRLVYAHWKDTQERMWLSGGSDGSVFFSDVWMFDPLINEWTWMAGSNLSDDISPHGMKCNAVQSFFPASRFENSSCWTDNNSNFWVFGGSETEFNFNPFNDLWCFQPQSNRWIWISGDSISQQPGYYGTQGIASSSNIASARSGSTAWIDCESNLWLFGGASYFVGMFNDLWKFQIDPDCIPGYQVVSCNPSPINFQSTDQFLCEKFCIDFFDSSLNNPTSWQWLFPGGNPSSSTLQNPTSICYDVPGVYDVTLITTNANGNDTLTLSNYITVYPTPPFPTITQVGYTLTSSPADSYQWQLNSADIPGATNQSYTILQTGYYTVVVSDSNGCKNSFTVYILISGINDLMSDTNISIYPNPSSGNFIVELLNGPDLVGLAGEISIDVVNVIGQRVFSSTEKISTTHWKKQIDLHDIARGVYFIGIKAENKFVRKKILIAD